MKKVQVISLTLPKGLYLFTLYNPKGVRLLQLFLHFTHEETEAQSGSITRSKSHDWESDTGRFQGSAIWLAEWSLDHEAVSPL